MIVLIIDVNVVPLFQILCFIVADNIFLDFSRGTTILFSLRSEKQFRYALIPRAIQRINFKNRLSG